MEKLEENKYLWNFCLEKFLVLLVIMYILEKVK